MGPSPLDLVQLFLSLFMSLALIVGFIFIVVSAWKFMRASQSMAESMKSIAESLKKPEDQA
ncbi:MAG: hypothetical protein ACM3PP_13665 [Candidatus Saccharibacteria bacterium]